MFLLPILVLVAVGVIAYRLLHRQPHPAGGTLEGAGAVTIAHRPFWPTTMLGRFGVGSFGVGIAYRALVNVVQVPFLGWILLVAALVMTGVARFRLHDRSPTVLVVFIVTAIGGLLAVLFVAGEVFIGHD